MSSRQLAGWLLYTLSYLTSSTSIMAFDLEGHRGARGLSPENTLPAFATALSLGVTTLELDVGLTADNVVVVMHDRTLNPSVARDSSGRWLDDPGPSLFSLSFAVLRSYDVGRIDPQSDYARGFPRQTSVDGTHAPSLAEVFELTRKAGNEVVQFNIETKLSPESPGETASAVPFVDALIEVVQKYELDKRVIIQSFEWATLRHVQKVAPSIRTSYLTTQQAWFDNLRAGQPGVSPWTAGFDIDRFDGSVPGLVEAAGGDIWSPFYREINAHNLRDAHNRGLSVIVWTVNDEPEMIRMIELGVDGVISDYPDRLREVVSSLGLELPPPTVVQP